MLDLQSASKKQQVQDERESWQLDHKVICSKLSKLEGTFALRALNRVCLKEVLNIMYQCVQHLTTKTL